MDWRTLIDWQWARDARVDALERKIRRLEAGLEERAPALPLRRTDRGAAVGVGVPQPGAEGALEARG